MSTEWEMYTALGTCSLVAVTAAGFLFLAKQIRDNRTALETQARSQIYRLSFETYKLLVDHPDLRPYFYEDKSLDGLSESERQRLLAAAELFTDYFEGIFLARASLDEETVSLWRDYMRSLHGTSSAIRRFIDGNKAYSQSFLDFLKGK